MIIIKTFGTTPPCAKCQEIKRRAQKIADKHSGRVEVMEFDALSEEGDKYGVMSTPTVVINDRIISVGRLLSEEELEKFINEVAGGHEA